MVRPIILTLSQNADVAALRRVFFNLLAQEDPNDVKPMDKAKVHVLEQDAFGIKVHRYYRDKQAEARKLHRVRPVGRRDQRSMDFRGIRRKPLRRARPDFGQFRQ